MLRLAEPSSATQPPSLPRVGWLLRLSGRLAGAHRMREICDAVGPSASPVEFARRLLESLDVRCALDEAAHARIPRAGRTLFVANHPLGPLDELITIAVLGSVRPDLRVLSGSQLLDAPGLAPLRFGPRIDAPTLRQAVRWLTSEHAVLAFPSGDVAHFDLRARCVTDPPWNPATGRLVRLTDALVVPVHLSGTSGKLFPAVGAVSSRLRRLLEPRELELRRGARVGVQVGAPIAAWRLARFQDSEAVAVHLRLKTLLASARTGVARTDAAREAAPIPPEMPCDALAAEVGALGDDNRLLRLGDLDVHVADSLQIPHLLSEIGRLRELALRANGGGTGRPRDLDRFDRDYEHVFIWQRSAQRVMGGCRIGRVDAIRARAGAQGLHSALQFRYREPALRLLGAALEVDPPFVREADDAGALTLLWKGIGELVARQPRYCRLLGRVTIGADYSETSRQLLTGYLGRQRGGALLARLVSARRPVPRSRPFGALSTELGLLSNLDPLSTLIEDVEADGKGLPPVLRQYLKLGGRVLSLGTSESGDAIECLLMIDLRHTKPRMLSRFLTDAGLVSFADAHALRLPEIVSSNRMSSGSME